MPNAARSPRSHSSPWHACGLLVFFLLLAGAVAFPGLGGGWILDDSANIVTNTALDPRHLTLLSFWIALMSSPSSPLHRPLSDLTFLINNLFTGPQPFWFHATNLGFRLVCGIAAFALVRRLILFAGALPGLHAGTRSRAVADGGLVAAVVVGAWLLAPINLSAVLYAVQRMQILSTLFILCGLLCYASGRQRQITGRRHGGILAVGGMAACTLIGVLAKEDAAVTPLYALLLEVFLFRGAGTPRRFLSVTFLMTLVVPGLIGAAWILPPLFHASAWSGRGFTMGERVLTEARVVCDYIVWTLFPTPHGLSFYHDNVLASRGWLSPPTTLFAWIACTVLVASTAWLRTRLPLVGLGIAWFFCAQIMTGTILPLELAFEHRNDFASLGLLMAVVSLLWAMIRSTASVTEHNPSPHLSLRPVGIILLLFLFGSSIALDVSTSVAWGHPGDRAVMLYARNPASGRACMGVARDLIARTLTPRDSAATLAARILRRCARLHGSMVSATALLIMEHQRLGFLVEPAWWLRLDRRFASRSLSPEDTVALRALVRCVEVGHCSPDRVHLLGALDAAVSHHPVPADVLLAASEGYLLLGHSHAALMAARQAARHGGAVALGNLVHVAALTGQRDEAAVALHTLMRNPFLRARLRASTLARLTACVTYGHPGHGCPP